MDYVVQGVVDFKLRYTVSILVSTQTTYLILMCLLCMQGFWVSIMIKCISDPLMLSWVTYFWMLKSIESALTHWPRMNKDFKSGFDIVGGNKTEIEDHRCLRVYYNQWLQAVSSSKNKVHCLLFHSIEKSVRNYLKLLPSCRPKH